MTAVCGWRHTAGCTSAACIGSISCYDQDCKVVIKFQHNHQRSPATPLLLPPPAAILLPLPLHRPCRLTQQVRACHSRKDWWFDRGAVKPVHMRYVPESLRAAVRPAWGDYVALTSDHAAFGAAADGPLEPGNLGVVVAVAAAADAEGGLGQARYTVRGCHNGQVFR